MNRYEPLKIEQKWQEKWEKESPFRALDGAKAPKKFLAEMFPYPSGAGLHVGHVRNFTIVDILARFYAQKGFNVLRPFGYDTFGLPAENYAIKTGVSPQSATKINVENFRKQLKRLGYYIDWDREINTSNPEYYRWTQWCFLQLYKKGLAYQKESYQWWCPVDQTVLANEQVENGHCWRCGAEVEKKKMKQWFFKITEYADELLEEIDSLDWPDKIKTMQKNWIGKSTGAEIEFELAPDSQETSDSSTKTAITVFTTRPDTIFGATFLVLAPEHPLVPLLATENTRPAVEKYCADSLKKSEIERQENKEKTGVFTGSYAINPATGEKIPIWVADYILSGYGTGAIMAVPAGDERDREFAEKFNLEIREIEKTPEKPFGKEKTTYRMRDWLISRQRYWGCPIPIAYDKSRNPHPIPEDQLPVLIPEVSDYKPDNTGRSALAKATDWLKVKIPVVDEKTGETHLEEMTRETDTLDGYACSSWYLWRYASPNCSEFAWDPEKIAYWEPLDIYCGADHAVAHLLYIRFWAKFFADEGKLPFREPVKTLLYNGYINAPDGKKMSKSKGNVIDPLDVINSGYGADTLRTYEMFIGPYDLDAAWNPRSVGGVHRFLSRVYALAFDKQTPENALKNSGKTDKAPEEIPQNAPLRAKTIKRVTEDIERYSFNTAVSALMEFVNDLYKSGASAEDIIILAKLLKPFAPHLASEILEAYHSDDSWPVCDESLLESDLVQIIVQVNGKLRGKLSLPAEFLENEEEVKKLALEDKNVQKFVKTTPKKTIFVKKAKLLNFVV
ncbi:leucine--tRNA ligase [Candidatus Saccharibacteria bacterium]|nr:leucine--tRNA ligase [Candidatus Saccharibacteria bacterium]